MQSSKASSPSGRGKQVQTEKTYRFPDNIDRDQLTLSEIKSGGPHSKTAPIRKQIEKDVLLRKNGWKIEWIFEKDPSRGLQELLRENGIEPKVIPELFEN